MENEMNEFSRNDVKDILNKEFYDFSNWEFPIFFAETIIKYFSDIFDLGTSSINTHPYRLMEKDTEVIDDMVRTRFMLRPLDMSKDTLDDSAKIYWITSCNLIYKDGHRLPFAIEHCTSQLLKNEMVDLLLQHANEIFKDTDSPELDILLNIMADISECGNPKSSDDPDSDDEDYCLFN